MMKSCRMAARLYRGLLHVYPRTFRQRYGTAMLELFSARHQRARGTGGLLVGVRFWTEILSDLITTATGERLEAWGLHPGQRYDDRRRRVTSSAERALVWNHSSWIPSNPSGGWRSRQDSP